MSAYIVENKVIDRITGWLFVYRGNSMEDYQAARIADEFLQASQLGVIRSGPREAWNTVGRALLDMNARAVKARYPQDSDREPSAYQANCVLSTKVQVYKSVQCLAYQCNEGQVPETALYKALRRLGRDLAELIVDHSAEYEQAEW